ncbi:uncharacterized protein QC764_0112630 [Podospora pseudoanserina]|uniref:Uncharacterized protein n=1 Tax=Podospora pseudoanserina TaxID=2609844 RepID=A0ABR0HJF0_9PEZI|nr:hypothetical protein QC764_0112630 [Podospora pseudoanserina]
MSADEPPEQSLALTTNKCSHVLLAPWRNIIAHPASTCTDPIPFPFPPYSTSCSAMNLMTCPPERNCPSQNTDQATDTT